MVSQPVERRIGLVGRPIMPVPYRSAECVVWLWFCTMLYLLYVSVANALPAPSRTEASSVFEDSEDFVLDTRPNMTFYPNFPLPPQLGMVESDSASFVLDTRPNMTFYPNFPIPPQFGLAEAYSATFTLDTRPNFNFATFSDSGNFVLDTRAGTSGWFLTGLRIEGSAAIPSGGTQQYRCLAQFSNGRFVDASSAATWRVVSDSPLGTYFDGERLVVGSTLTDYPIQLIAEYKDINTGITASSGTFSVIVKAGFRAWISHVIRLDQTYAAGKVTLSVETTGTTGPLSYRWNLTGSATHGSLTAKETEATYAQRGTYPLSVTVSDGIFEVTPYAFITIDASPVANQPRGRPAPDPESGSVRNSFDPSLLLEFDAEWERRKTNGLIIITHGLDSSATNEWLREMALAIQERYSTNALACPNIVLYDWERDADPYRISEKYRIRLPRSWRYAGGINWSNVAEAPLTMLDFVADCYGVRITGPIHGIFLATWILKNIDEGHIVRTAPIHLIGHSAGGFLGGECGLVLGDVVPVQQVTMLDTPFAYRGHVKGYQRFGKVERYISSVFGGLTFNFRTPGDGRIDDISVDCTLAELGCKSFGGNRTALWCGLACNWGISVPTSSQYHRSVTYDRQESVKWRDHQRAHEWYAETVTNGTNNGFFFSPWLKHSFPSATSIARSSTAEWEEPEMPEQAVWGFNTFGVVSVEDGEYHLIETTDAGIFVEMELPVGTEAIKFDYQFEAAGDGDFLSVHWGTNDVLYIGPDTDATRRAPIQAEVPAKDLAGQADRLMFRLTSRGETNAAVVLHNIHVLLNPDADGDGIINSVEVTLGTDPLSADSDGDGLDDGIEIQELGTNPVLADSDGDGFLDSEELYAGTDALDGSLSLAITAVEMNSDEWITLEWKGAPGRSYRVNQSTTFPTELYFTLTNGLPAELPVTRFRAPPPITDSQFYWIEVE